MVDYREILRLKSLNYSNVDIASSVHSSRNTIHEVLKLAELLNVKWPLDDDVTNYTLESLLTSHVFPTQTKTRHQSHAVNDGANCLCTLKKRQDFGSGF